MACIRLTFWSLDHKHQWRLKAHPRTERRLWELAARLGQGKALRAGEWPLRPPVLIYHIRPAIFDDFPATDDDVPVVSDPFRQFLEREAPGACEFLPIRIEGPGMSRVRHGFWAVNFLQVFDCLDPRSIERSEEGPRIVATIINPSRIPLDGVLGLVGGFKWLRLIRNDLRLKIIRAGFAGLSYGAVPHSVSTDRLPFMRADGTIVLPDGAPADTPLPPPRPRTPKPHTSRRTKRKRA